MSISLRFDPMACATRIAQVRGRQLAAIEAYGDAAANKCLKYAKRNRPWQDRSHDAKNTMTGSSGWAAGRYRVAIAHGMDYGVYLEHVRFKHKGRLAILQPTIDAMGPEIIRAWAERIGRV